MVRDAAAQASRRGAFVQNDEDFMPEERGDFGEIVPARPRHGGSIFGGAASVVRKKHLVADDRERHEVMRPREHEAACSLRNTRPSFVEEIVQDDDSTPTQHSTRRFQIMASLIGSVATVDREQPRPRDAVAEHLFDIEVARIDRDRLDAVRVAPMLPRVGQKLLEIAAARLIGVLELPGEEIVGDGTLAAARRQAEQDEKTPVMNADLAHGAG